MSAESCSVAMNAFDHWTHPFRHMNRGWRERFAPAAAIKGSEEAQRLRAVADQQVLRLLIVIQHHLMGFAADAGLLVAAERRMRGIGMVAVGPHAPGLDGAAAYDRRGCRCASTRRRRGRRACRWRWRALLPRPRRSSPKRRARRFPPGRCASCCGLRARSARRNSRPSSSPSSMVAFAAGQNLGAFLLADVDIGQDLLQLIVGGLRADHGRRDRADGPA